MVEVGCGRKGGLYRAFMWGGPTKNTKKNSHRFGVGPVENAHIWGSEMCVTLKTAKPMLKFSPWPIFLWIFMSFCCKEIRTSSTSFVTSNKYCKRSWNWVSMCTCPWAQLYVMRECSTCGFCRNVRLWLEQPPQRFNSGSAFLVQFPKCTTSCHVLWMLITDVLMRRQTSASVNNLHQSVNDIL